ncbi:hypothetical protein [Mucilaginibacter sp.]|uniref:hypothetical protein n=1 Tax=Mucilaginibacter sp. TaxID=1882438 RepID=UPI002635E1D7|nr:hypothetical protein [Mucilaginibacter sp.]MDB4925508.1 hypothetical protein [Mucilaginibacter sp.]
MKYELETLETLAGEWAVNQTLTTLGEQKKSFIDEAWRTKKAIIHNLLLQKNQTLLHTYFTIHMQKLVELCDKVFDAVGQDTAHSVVIAILDLLDALKKAVPGLIDRDLALPKAFRVIQGKRLADEWEQLLPKLKNIGATPELLEIAVLPFEEFSSLKLKLSWFHYIWLKQYLYELDNLDFSKFEPYPSAVHLIHECLIRLDFNHSRFMAYCCKVIRESTDQFEEPKEQLLVLSMSRKIIRQFPMISGEPFYQKKQSIIKDLIKWVDEETDFRSVYDLGIFASIGKKVPVNPYKFIYDMTLEQLAFWKKLQYDHKLYIEDNLDSFSIKIAYNSSTRNKDELSIGSITSKLYSKDHKVISPVYELILAMFTTMQPIMELLQKMLDDLKPFMA